MDPGMGENRRTFARYDTQVPVRFTSEMLDFDGTVELEQGSVENVSQGGLFVRSEFLEIPGTPVLLLLKVPPTGEEVRRGGIVAWVADEPPAGPGMGIRLRGTLDRQTIDWLVGGPA